MTAVDGDRRADIVRGVTEIWAAQLGVGDIQPDEDFFDLGGHSLQALEIVERIEHRFGVAVSLRELYEEPTVDGLVGRLYSANAETAQAETAQAEGEPT